MLDRFVEVAYADESLPAEVEGAAMRRKARYQDLVSAESNGRIGENRSGFVELRPAGAGDASAAGRANHRRPASGDTAVREHTADIAAAPGAHPGGPAAAVAGSVPRPDPRDSGCETASRPSPGRHDLACGSSDRQSCPASRRQPAGAAAKRRAADCCPARQSADPSAGRAGAASG